MERGLEWDETSRRGDLGESFLRWYCYENYLSFRRAKKVENLEEGWDVLIEGVPTDVKNTPSIYFAKYSTKHYNGEFLVRHPFREGSKAKDYVILAINEKEKTFAIKYHGGIEDYLCEKFFIDLKALNEAKKFLNTFHQKSYISKRYTSINQLLFTTKTEMEKLLKPDLIYCGYESTEDGLLYKKKELSMHIITKIEKEELKRLK